MVGPIYYMGRCVEGKYKLPRVTDNKFMCPCCGAPINWTCPGGNGTKGYAYCSRSINATQVWRKGYRPPAPCVWKGEVRRLSNFKVDIWDDREWTKELLS